MSAATQRYPAPAVQFPLRRSPVLAGALTFLNAAALLVLLAWMSAGAGTHCRAGASALDGGRCAGRAILDSAPRGHARLGRAGLGVAGHWQHSGAAAFGERGGHSA